ncbi:hypothetical protein ACHAQA_006996 [Verticillium albo-atrum]
MEFWLAEIPRACHVDPAIWHAIVSLGAAHESYASRGLSISSFSPQRTFALQQFGLSIRSLMEQTAHQSDTGRALIISVIFTCICTVQGLHSQARMHLKSGRKLLQEVQSQSDPPRAKSLLHKGKAGPPSPHQLQLSCGPVSLAPLKAQLINLELQAAVKDNGGLVWSPELLTESDYFTLWRFYEAPQEATKSSRTPRPPTIDGVMQAHKAVESLFNGLIYLRQQLMKQPLDKVKSIGPGDLNELITREAHHIRCFKQIKKAHRHFTEARSLQSSSAVPLKALLTLSLALAATRLLFIGDPEIPDQVKRAESLPQQYQDIVDLTERILKPDSAPSLAYPPSATVTSALLTVAHSGTPQSLRRRAVKLLVQYPRREGLSSSLESASFANAMMDREQEVLREELSKNGLPDTNQDLEVPPLTRIFNSTFKYVGDRSALLLLRTWGEYLEGRPGKERVIHW